MDEVERIISQAPDWVKREADGYGCMIPMSDSEYRKLIGENFWTFFHIRQEGESTNYAWNTRHADQLNNLHIWKKR